ncbi:MAG: hypothetical protein JW974_03860 [Alphaproteobacteria bacterium]|nr:hypothetical protein [Alphaproteobacteria bacterium]MBN2675123.1 hypothetical protein [Alphaproteobacteria bacterium]
MEKFSKTKALKIISSRLLSKFSSGFKLVLSDGTKLTVKIEDFRHGKNIPKVGKYLIPCNLVCKNRTGNCIKFNKNVKAPVCSGQFYYTRNRSR